MSADITSTPPPAPPPSVVRGHSLDTRTWLWRCLFWSVAGGSTLLLASWLAAITGDHPEVGVYYFSRLFALFALVVPLVVIAGNLLGWYLLGQEKPEAARVAGYTPLIVLVALAWPFVLLCGLSFDPLGSRPPRQLQGGQPTSPGQQPTSPGQQQPPPRPEKKT